MVTKMEKRKEGKEKGREGGWTVGTDVPGSMEGPVCFFMVPQTFVISP